MPNPDMTLTIAGYDKDQLTRELAFATGALDLEHRENCEWLASLLTRRSEQLTAATTPLGNLCREIRAALESDSNDREHDALVSVAEHLGLSWTPHEG